MPSEKQYQPNKILIHTLDLRFSFSQRYHLLYEIYFSYIAFVEGIQETHPHTNKHTNTCEQNKIANLMNAVTQRVSSFDAAQINVYVSIDGSV